MRRWRQRAAAGGRGSFLHQRRYRFAVVQERQIITVKNDIPAKRYRGIEKKPKSLSRRGRIALESYHRGFFTVARKYACRAAGGERGIERDLMLCVYQNVEKCRVIFARRCRR